MLKHLVLDNLDVLVVIYKVFTLGGTVKHVFLNSLETGVGEIIVKVIYFIWLRDLF